MPDRSPGRALARGPVGKDANPIENLRHLRSDRADLLLTTNAHLMEFPDETALP